MSISEFLVLTLAVARITRLVTTDTIFGGIRERVWRRFPPGNGGIGYLITCDWCTSIYVASLLLGMYKIATVPTFYASLALAMSMLVGMANRVS